MSARSFSQRTLERYRETFLDSARPIDERVVALGMLRGFPAKRMARDARVVSQALALAREAREPEVRATIRRHLEGALAPSLAADLPGFLSSEADASVRAALVDLLFPLALMDPAASAALVHAAANDGDPEVRREAARGLARLGDRH